MVRASQVDPLTEVPAGWPQAYRDVVERRLEVIASNKFIVLLERPEFKRRWAGESWDTRVGKALRGWLLDRLEDRSYWFDAQGRPVALSVAQLADRVSRDADLVSVLEVWSGRKDRSVTEHLIHLLDAESVPFLAAYRLKDSGLCKRRAWEETWDLQRREDTGETVGVIPVPPKYTAADFRKPEWWRHRGKLDVPKGLWVVLWTVLRAGPGEGTPGGPLTSTSTCRERRVPRGTFLAGAVRRDDTETVVGRAG